MKKTAIVLFNLGGPDNLDAVEPFLFNLFNDPAIISLPFPFRYLLARWISWRRVPIATEIYKELGGSSPLVSMTKDQASALDDVLNSTDSEDVFKSFIAMRYWHPMSPETAAAVKDFEPDSIVLLPLYPQYSSTTTGSSITEWHRASREAGLQVPTHTVCCYPVSDGWISAQADLIAEGFAARENEGAIRFLFSAHGLPKKIIENGDPYQRQIEMTAAALVGALEARGISDIDWVVCYQSRVGRLEWIGPSTDDEISRASLGNVGVLVVPIAFVSEHSETLVELDIEYRDLAAKLGVLDYIRISTVGTHPKFINGLAKLVTQGLCRLASQGNIASETGVRICPADTTKCPIVVS